MRASKCWHGGETGHLKKEGWTELEDRVYACGSENEGWKCSLEPDGQRPSVPTRRVQTLPDRPQGTKWRRFPGGGSEGARHKALGSRSSFVSQEHTLGFLLYRAGTMMPISHSCQEDCTEISMQINVGSFPLEPDLSIWNIDQVAVPRTNHSGETLEVRTLVWLCKKPAFFKG